MVLAVCFGVGDPALFAGTGVRHELPLRATHILRADHLIHGVCVDTHLGPHRGHEVNGRDCRQVREEYDRGHGSPDCIVLGARLQQRGRGNRGSLWQGRLLGSSLDEVLSRSRSSHGHRSCMAYIHSQDRDGLRSKAQRGEGRRQEQFELSVTGFSVLTNRALENHWSSARLRGCKPTGAQSIAPGVDAIRETHCPCSKKIFTPPMCRASDARPRTLPRCLVIVHGNSLTSPI
mmetsp:Transcript_48448/g.112270  ORF Transcript_48448/g.112270 Transcript_48448/m.112270 type:complete len:233 (+) Transcript_48448:1409-2107(+)